MSLAAGLPATGTVVQSIVEGWSPLDAMCCSSGPRFYDVVVFAIASVLSVLLGRALATIAAVGVPSV